MLIDERELGWRSDLSLLGERGVLTAGLQVRRIDPDFDRRLTGDGTRFVYDGGDFRADPEQRYISITS
jgi:hypothetical protein